MVIHISQQNSLIHLGGNTILTDHIYIYIMYNTCSVEILGWISNNSTSRRQRIDKTTEHFEVHLSAWAAVQNEHYELTLHLLLWVLARSGSTSVDFQLTADTRLSSFLEAFHIQSIQELTSMEHWLFPPY